VSGALVPAGKPRYVLHVRPTRSQRLSDEEAASCIRAFTTRNDPRLAPEDERYLRLVVQSMCFKLAIVPERAIELRGRVWVRLCANRLNFEHRAPSAPVAALFWGWVRGMVRSEWAEMKRESAKRAHINVALDEDLLHFIRDRGLTPEQALLAKEVIAVLQAFVLDADSGLTPRQRAALTALLADQSFAEAAMGSEFDQRSLEQASAPAIGKARLHLELHGYIRDGKIDFVKTDADGASVARTGASSDNAVFTE
jgi:hypothetical protein